LESFIKAAEQLAADEAEWKKAQDKAQEDAVRKAKEAQILAMETAKATSDALMEQIQAADEGIDRKRRLMTDRLEELKDQMVGKRKDLEAKLEAAKKEGPTSDAALEAKAALEAHIRTNERVMAEEEARINAQMEQLQSALIDLVTKHRAAEAKLKKLGAQ
jgi:hypothetical protein